MSIRSLQNKTFPFFSIASIKRYFRLLIDRKWILDRKSSLNKFDHTKEYRVNLKKIYKDMGVEGISTENIKISIDNSKNGGNLDGSLISNQINSKKTIDLSKNGGISDGSSMIHQWFSCSALKIPEKEPISLKKWLKSRRSKNEPSRFPRVFTFWKKDSFKINDLGEDMKITLDKKLSTPPYNPPRGCTNIDDSFDTFSSTQKSIENNLKTNLGMMMGGGSRGEEEENLGNASFLGSDGSYHPATPIPVLESLLRAWKVHIGQNARLTPKRHPKLQRLFFNEFQNDVSKWEDFCRYISESDFLMGKTIKWRADIDWVLEPRNHIKLLEGKYHDFSSFWERSEINAQENGRADNSYNVVDEIKDPLWREWCFSLLRVNPQAKNVVKKIEGCIFVEYDGRDVVIQCPTKESMDVLENFRWELQDIMEKHFKAPRIVACFSLESV